MLIIEAWRRHTPSFDNPDDNQKVCRTLLWERFGWKATENRLKTSYYAERISQPLPCKEQCRSFHFPDFNREIWLLVILGRSLETRYQKDIGFPFALILP